MRILGVLCEERTTKQVAELLHTALGVARAEGTASPRDERYRLTIAFYPLETAGGDATRPPPAKTQTATKRRTR